jgi:glycosyltransferase involved in cell wall biosynthesis
VTQPFLSLIIPAYNEERRLPESLDKIIRFLEKQSFDSRIWVVDNASTDATPEILADYADRSPLIQQAYEPQPGKGAAVRRGMLKARGQFRFMADADLSMPIQEITRFLPPRLEHFDIAIASREAEGAVRYGEPAYRHWGGRMMNLFIRTLALPELQDTQCGFKCFTGRAAEDLFRCQTLDGWSFDIEILYIARLRGYRIEEIPIPWYFNADTKVNAVKDALKMLWDIAAIRRNHQLGVYEQEN